MLTWLRPALVNLHVTETSCISRVAATRVVAQAIQARAEVARDAGAVVDVDLARVAAVAYG